MLKTDRNFAKLLGLASCLLSMTALADEGDKGRPYDDEAAVQVGPRPYYLIDKMSPSPLKRKLEQCADGPFYKTDFSIGHRGGGTLQFPEHTKESHVAGSRMGAGILLAGINTASIDLRPNEDPSCRHVHDA